MKKVKLAFAIVLLAISCSSNAQDSHGITDQTTTPKLIAVVNTANWCAVCKANGQRFQQLLMPYVTQGVTVYINDITNSTTKQASKITLQKANVYQAVATMPRKGMGKMLQSCGLAKDKKQFTEVSGIVTFINPKTYKQIKQLSIASPNEEMKNTIETLLKNNYEKKY